MTLTPAQVEQTRLIDTEFYVEGYAARYAPYELYRDADGPIYEEFKRSAFDETDMSDILFQFNHQGTVYARQSNGSLIVKADDVGLFTAADLGRTPAARDKYAEIKEKMLTKMSWGFVVGDYEFDKKTRTIVHNRVKKIFDVSVVSLPANDTTSINARAFCDGVIAEHLRSDRELEDRRLRLKIKTQIMEGK